MKPKIKLKQISKTGEKSNASSLPNSNESYWLKIRERRGQIIKKI